MKASAIIQDFTVSACKFGLPEKCVHTANMAPSIPEPLGQGQSAGTGLLAMHINSVSNESTKIVGGVGLTKSPAHSPAWLFM